MEKENSLYAATIQGRYEFLETLINKNIIVKVVHGRWYRGVLISVDEELNLLLVNVKAVDGSTVNEESLLIKSSMCQYIGEDPSEINFEELGLQEDPLFARTHLSTTSASSVEDIAGTSSERKIEEPKEYIPGTTIENLPGTSTQTMFADRDSLNPAPQSSGEEISKTVEGGDSLIIIFKRKRSMTSSISDSSIDSDSGSDVNVTKKFKHSPEDEEKSE